VCSAHECRNRKVVGLAVGELLYVGRRIGYERACRDQGVTLGSVVVGALSVDYLVLIWDVRSVHWDRAVDVGGAIPKSVEASLVQEQVNGERVRVVD